MRVAELLMAFVIVFVLGLVVGLYALYLCIAKAVTSLERCIDKGTGRG